MSVSQVGTRLLAGQGWLGEDVPSLPLQSHTGLGPSVPAEQPQWVPHSSSGSRGFPRRWKSPLPPLRGVSSEMSPLPQDVGGLQELSHLFFTHCGLAMAESIALCHLPLPKGILCHRVTGMQSVAHGLQLLCRCHSSALGGRGELSPEAGG